MIEIAVFKNFILAIALGALIGLEREYARFHDRGHAYAGIRTFPLLALVGALAAFLGQVLSIWILFISMVIVGVLIITAYIMISKQDPKHSGTTSEVAGLLVFFIGMFSYYGEFTFAITLTVIITIILYARSMLHHFAERITRKEMVDTIVFVMIAFVVLPFLPDRWYGPLELFNPYILWFMVVLISGISFAGYVLMKFYGQKGVELAGILGGLVSSTGVTMSFAERSRKETKIFKALALGVIAANGIMFFRVLVVLSVVNKDMLWRIILPLCVLGAISAIFSYIFWKGIKEVKSKTMIGSPLRLLPALKFSIFFAVTLALIKFAEAYFSSQGVYIISFLAGFADVDAITISLAQLSKTTLLPDVAARGILLAVLTNVAVKGGIAYWFGGERFKKIVIPFFALLIVVGVGMIFFI